MCLLLCLPQHVWRTRTAPAKGEFRPPGPNPYIAMFTAGGTAGVSSSSSSIFGSAAAASAPKVVFGKPQEQQQQQQSSGFGAKFGPGAAAGEAGPNCVCPNSYALVQLTVVGWMFDLTVMHPETPEQGPPPPNGDRGGERARRGVGKRVGKGVKLGALLCIGKRL
jgi:hypothetical protein